MGQKQTHKQIMFIYLQFILFQILLGFAMFYIIPNFEGEESIALGEPTILLLGAVAVLVVVCGLTIEKLFRGKVKGVMALSIIRAAMFETCGIIGFLAAITSQTPMVGLPFIVISIVLLILKFPRPSSQLEVYEGRAYRPIE